MEICTAVCVKFCDLFDGDLYDYLCKVLWACLMEICTTICVTFCGLFDGDLYDYLCEVLWAV